MSSSALACLTSSVDHFFRHSGPGLYGVESAGAMEPGVPMPEPERLVQLVPVDPHRQRPAEVGGVEPLRHLGVRVVGVVDLERGVGAVQRRVEPDVVADLVPVLEEHRELGHGRVALLEVVLAGDGPEVEHLEVLGDGHLDAVDVRKLVARGVHLVEERVPLHRPGRVVDGRDRLPGRQHRQLGVEPPVPAVLDVRRPSRRSWRPWPSRSPRPCPMYFGWNCLM